MKQNIRLIKQNIWFDKIEPYTQINIMKIIALNGFLSKNNIVEKMFGNQTEDERKKALKLVDSTVSKMLDEKNKLLQPVKKEKEAGTKRSTFFSLTENGIEILIKNSFEKNQRNDEKEISGKKYLSLDEMIIFINRFKKDYIIQKSQLKKWEAPKLTEENIRILCSGEDKKLYITLIERTGSNSSKVKKLIKQFRDAEQKINDVLEEIPQAILETIVLSFKK